MRLTPHVVHSAQQSLNCLGDRELVLRNLAIPLIENLAVARDSFDTIDLSSNTISNLGDGFPPFPRLRTLYLGSNRISTISKGIAHSLPNLHTLILTANRIATVEDLNLTELSRFKHLQVLSIQHNPVANQPHIRRKILQAIPTLTVLNFSKISAKERKSITPVNAISNPKKRKSTATPSQQSDPKRRRSTTSPDSSQLVENTKASPKRAMALSPSEAAAVRARIEAAQTVEEVARIHNAVKNGTIRDILNIITQPQQTQVVKPT
ncbi:U2 small nuclear ribonucleoprotein A' [Gracilariopsis chorda]|uniref:U2 small nuclear ribonucleoprotein A n=1 Tax=Gracilariopsis chorda TaxID=448386 RepID=A0A2V3IMK2_9FLOR|nr:U2 small nuclear ribonucleoprotein A' [Gracilariopsis chorda]|eukprot:PXF43308.1 U2 small nuclear ribonucleoprotein A' [Gracilariopsis chorda]